ncbi:MAG TPA: hypothetical protein DCP91_00895, partial [Eggerthellaceae bacterium]|nr:hypothetical protein [Eggerthellaceae bacterium]
MCLFMAFIVFIAPALEIFGANGDSLVFPLPVVWWVPPLFCVPIAIGVAALLACVRGRAFYYALGVVFLITLAAYVQSLFLNQGMMPADGGYVGWNEPYFIVRKVVSGIVWAAIIVVPLALLRFNFHGSLKAACALACAIMVVQGVGVASVALDASKTSQADSARPYVTQGGLLSVSPESNVIVFVLDTYDTALLQAILQQDPGFLADFEDFTYFPDSVGTMIPTANAVPNLLTGLKPKPGQDLGEYRRDKYAKSRFLGDIAAQGYSVGLYSDSLMMDFANPADRAAADLTMNVHPVSHAPIDVWRTFLVMEQCALYREAPWLLKEPFWYYTSNLNNRMIADAHDGDLGDSLYELDDAAILDLLHTRGLSADDVEGAGAFRFIHLFGPHFPYSVDEQGHDVGTNHSDQLAQARGSMHVVAEYLAQLKALGLYDQATIIVTADHGVWYITDDPPRAPISPIMLAKPARTAPAGVDEPAGAPESAGAGEPAGAAAPAESTAPATAAPATAGADEPA